MGLSRPNHIDVHNEEAGLRAARGLGRNDMMTSDKIEIRIMRQAVCNRLAAIKIVVIIEQFKTARKMAIAWFKKLDAINHV